MKPSDHPLLQRANLIELLFQSPVWVVAYATGLVFFMEVFAWVAYGLGWHIHPSRYPLPHTMVLDFLSEVMRWLRTQHPLPRKLNVVVQVAFAAALLIGTPLLFITYAKYLYGFWIGGRPFDLLSHF